MSVLICKLEDNAVKIIHVEKIRSTQVLALYLHHNMEFPTPPGGGPNTTELTGYPVTMVTVATGAELSANTEDVHLLPHTHFVHTPVDQSILERLSSVNYPPAPDHPSTIDPLSTSIQSPAFTHPPTVPNPLPPDHMPAVVQQLTLNHPLVSDQRSSLGHSTSPSLPTSDQPHVSDQLAELLDPTVSTLPPSSGLIKCPVFCLGNCVVQHHPLLVAILNCEDTGAMELMDMKLGILQSVIQKYKQGSLKWDYDDPIPDVVPKYRYPMIHWACMLGRVGVAVWLIGHRYSVSTTRAAAMFGSDDQNGETGLHKALCCLQETCPTNASRKFVQLLSVMEPAISVTDKFGDTPIHVCCRMLCDSQPGFYTECLQNMILELAKSRNSAGVALVLNAKNNDGDTALHFISSWNKLLTQIMLLRQFGANPFIQNKQGVTARHLMERTPMNPHVLEPNINAPLTTHSVNTPELLNSNILSASEASVLSQTLPTSPQPEITEIRRSPLAESQHLPTHGSTQTITQPSPTERKCSVPQSLQHTQINLPTENTTNSSESLVLRPESDMETEGTLFGTQSLSSEAETTPHIKATPPTSTLETNTGIVNITPVQHVVTEFPLTQNISEKLPSPKNEAPDSASSKMKILRRFSETVFDGHGQNVDLVISSGTGPGSLGTDANVSPPGAVGGTALEEQSSEPTLPSSPTPIPLFDNPTDEERTVQKYFEDTIKEMSAKNETTESRAPILEDYQTLLEGKQYESAAYHLYSPRETHHVVDRIESLKTADNDTQLAIIKAIVQKRNKALQELSLANKGIDRLQQKYRDTQQEQDSVVKEIVGIMANLSDLQQEEKTLNSDLAALDTKNTNVKFTNDHLKERLGNCQDAIVVLKRLRREERVEKGIKQQKT